MKNQHFDHTPITAINYSYSGHNNQEQQHLIKVNKCTAKANCI